jgi:predicted Zn-dependent protease
MKEELTRSTKALRLPGYEPPYFVSYLVRDGEVREVTASLGAVFDQRQHRGRSAYVEVRTGGYTFDNTADQSQDDQLGGDNPDAYEPGTGAPLDDDASALRATLWLLTDYRYKKGLNDLHNKRGRRATAMVEDEKVASFSKEPPSRHRDPAVALTFDTAAWGDRLRRVSERLKAYPEIFDSTFKAGADRETRYYVSSEGSELITEHAIYALHVEAVSRATDGMLVEHGRSWYGASPSDLPSEGELDRLVVKIADEVRALRTAPILDPYTGPAILLPEASGVFFHEAIGHRLEGERQNDEKEGRTFKGQLGKPILPPFLTVVDNPSLSLWGNTPLNGTYRFDDEGVASRNVVLVENGVLRSYLMSRTPIAGAPHSNGHGRADGTQDPIGRMGNLIVSSSKRVPLARLEQMLVEEARSQGKPFGLMIADIDGGSTNTSTYGYQAFKGEARIVYKVDAKTGAKTLVRGVEMVGTPLTSINKIVAASEETNVFNGYCGAESGYVPVSAVAPAVLMTEIELQRSQRPRERPPLLNPPWPTPATGKAGRP